MLLFFNNMDYQSGDYVCGANVIDTKFVHAGSQIQHRKYHGRNSRAIVAAITICNQNLQAQYDTEELEDYIEGQNG